MDPSSYSDVSKNSQSAFYGALSGSVCFPMPLMYNPMNSYPFMSTPFLPMHHPMLSNHHGIQDSHMMSSSDVLNSNQMKVGSEELNSRALAYLQSRYQTMGKCFFPPTRSKTKYCLSPPSLLEQADKDPYSLQQTTPSLHSDGGQMDTSGGTLMTSPVSGGDWSSPSTEVEEPDSSGKCSTDVVEQKVIPRWSCDSSQPPICPICGRTIASSEMAEHYQMEVEKMNELLRKKDWLIQEDNPDHINSLRLQPYHDVEKKCPEFRKETYLRVRANRLNRLGGIGPRAKRQCFDETKHSWKLQRTSQLCSPKQEHMSDDPSAQSAHQSMLMLELTVQQLAHRTEGRTDISSETFSAEKSISHYQGQNHPEGYRDDQNKNDLADSSCNGFNNLENPGERQTPGYPESGRLPDSRPDDNPCSSEDFKCHVCMESYKIPVVSVCCWHVYCETCWLKALGSKRVCPQCDNITSPADLRRIHL